MAFECNWDKSRGLGRLAVMFCVSVVLLGGMVLPTVLIGVISLGFDEAALKIKLENKDAYALDHITRAAAEWNGRVTERQMECMRVIFEMVDFDSQGDISRGEFLPLLEMLCKRLQLKCFNDELLSDMFDVVSVSGNGSLSFPEVFLAHALPKTSVKQQRPIVGRCRGAQSTQCRGAQNTRLHDRRRVRVCITF
jgi:hypothetical protein